jgi:transmembrane sensor
MDLKYLTYDIEELIQDRSFILFIKKGQNIKEWESFLKEHHDFEEKASLARKIILNLQEKEDVVSKDEIDFLWQNIDQFYSRELKNKKGSLSFRTIFRYAAIFILFLSVSGIVSWYAINKNSKFHFANSEILNEKNAQLMLANGEAIDLKKKESKIIINSTDDVININSDTIISMPKADNGRAALLYNEVVVPFGKKSVIELEDGTKIWLNAGSRFAFPTHFAGNKREVFLDGEAFFDVAHNEAKPFFINTGEVTIKVLGTRFDLSAYKLDADITTVLEEGKIAISRNNTLSLTEKETLITPEHKAVYNKALKTLIVKDEPDMEFYTAWIEGWLPFSKESLFVVFNKLQRYYNVKFIYGESFSTDDFITGKLDLKNSLSEVLRTLSDLTRISYRIENENIYIESTKK